ncbi:hypothetical protein M5689_001213 [Euphorbia peplus]|nr:hypothetical protein M5689_001213 [Euphorbia peplus]
MISLLKLARKRHKFAAIRRKQIAPQQVIESVETQAVFGESATAAKGRFVVYSTDQKRFSLPLEYLNNEIIRVLFNMAEEEFGLPRKGPLTLPCDAELLGYVISLIKKKVYGTVQKALAVSIVSCLPSLHHRHQETSHQLPICSF